MNKMSAIVALTLAAVSGAAQAVLVDASTAEAVSFRYCIAGTSACDNLTAPVEVDYGGTPGAATSGASGAVAGMGSAAATVSLSGIIGAPILRATASSDPGARVNTTSFALQSYLYTGAASTTRTFGGTLTYIQSLTGPYPADKDNGNGIVAGIDVFTLPVSQVEVGDTAESNFGALADPTSLPGYSDLGNQGYFDSSSTPGASATLGVTVTLTPGETIWVWVLLQTPTPNGGMVDASHTFVSGWDDASNLVPAVVVPEPATGGMLALGIVTLMVWRRLAEVVPVGRRSLGA